MVDSIMACLSPPSAGVNRNVRPVLSPNFLTNKLQPLLGLSKRGEREVGVLCVYCHIEDTASLSTWGGGSSVQ